MKKYARLLIPGREKMDTLHTRPNVSISVRLITIAIAFLFALLAFPNLISLSQTSSPTIIQIDNPEPQANAHFGQSVRGIGDINSDGVGDLAIGAPGADKVYLFSGSDQSLIRTLSDPDGLTGYDFGFSLDGVGDVDGDGTEDLAVGAPYAFNLIIPFPPPTPEWGRAFILSGATGNLIRTADPGISFRGGLDDYFQLGFAVAGLGDVNGDGVPDYTVSAPVVNLRSSWGEVYAFSGADGGQMWVNGEPGFPNVIQPLPSFGWFMTGILDVTGDGRRDLLVGAPNFDLDPDPNVYLLAGEGYVLSGSDGSIFRTHKNPSPANSDLFGSGPAGIGDQDGDGIEDYVFGEAGAAILHLFRGVNGDHIMSIPTPSGDSTDFFGYCTTGVDDKDGDGVSDFWVSAPKGGKVYLMNGLGDTLLQVADPSPFPSPDVNSFGRSIAVTGDLDNDGGLDLIIGKPNQNVGAFDNAGAVFLVLGVRPNRPPAANAGSDQTVEQTSYQGASVTLDGSSSYDPDDDPLTYSWTWDSDSASGVNPTIQLPLGTHTITLTVDDGKSGTDSDTVIIIVIDTTPPKINLSVSPNILWPPNHKMFLITPTITVSDNCDPNPVVVLTSITMTEGDETNTFDLIYGSTVGDGHTLNDIQIDKNGDIYLRAERSGTGTGRIYTIIYTVTDASGNSVTASATVTVPHDKN